MASLMVDIDQGAGIKSPLEPPENQTKDGVQTITLSSSADEVASSPISHKDSTAENGNPSPKDSHELTSTQRKNVKKQNGLNHHFKSSKGSGKAQITATVPKKCSDESTKNQQNSPDSEIAAKCSQDGVKEPAHQESSVTQGEQKNDEESALDVKEALENSCSVAPVEPPQSHIDQAVQQTESAQDTISSSQGADYSSKDPNSCESVIVTQPTYSPPNSSTEEKINQTFPDGTFLNPLTTSLDESSNPSRPANEKPAEKKIFHRGLRKGFEKPPKISTNFHTPAKMQTSSSIFQKSVPVVQLVKSPKTPPKSISPVKASKVSPESAESEGSVEKEDPKIIRESSPEKPLKKSLVPVFKSRKSRLGQKVNTSNDQQMEVSEDGLTNNGNLAENSKQQDAHPSNLGKGLLLLKVAKLSYASGDNPNKALEHATRAVRFFESNASDSSSLELLLSLHILAAVHCTLGQYDEAISVLQCSLALMDSKPKSLEGIPDDCPTTEQMLALFSGQMQLGDTFVLNGMQEKSLQSYHIALEIQKQALGDMDPLVGETCRYLAEAHLQAMQFKEAEEMCKHVLKIHSENNSLGALEESTDRRLMALILSAKGEHEAALEHLVFASTALSSVAKEVDVAAVDCCIGDAYVALGRYDEAAFAYQKALTIFKSVKGETHSSVASIYVSLAEISLKTGKQREAKSHADNALQIYGKYGARHALDELAIGLTAVSAVYEAVHEQEQALCLLQRALDILQKAPGEHNAAAGVEAQMGIIYLGLGKPSNSFAAFKTAVLKLRAGSEKNTLLIGILLNQMGLACVELRELAYAAEVFQEAHSVLEEACGPHHPDTLAICSNLAGVYDALGRIDDAISLLESNIQVKEQRVGTVHRDVEDERQWLMELLREAGRPHIRKSNTLEQLFTLPSAGSSRYERTQIKFKSLPWHHITISTS